MQHEWELARCPFSGKGDSWVWGYFVQQLGHIGIPSLGTWAFFARSGLESTKRNKSHATRSAEHWWLYLLYVSIFWRSWNLRLFLVHHKKDFCIFEVFNNHRAYIAHLPKTFPGICDALNNYFGKSKMISCNPIEHAYRFPTLYQTTILGARWDFTRVINIKKSCQANYQ